MKKLLFFVLFLLIIASACTSTETPERTAEYFNTPERRLEWWNSLEPQWQMAFNKELILMKEDKNLSEEKLRSLFRNGPTPYVKKTTELDSILSIPNEEQLKILLELEIFVLRHQVSNLSGMRYLKYLKELNCSDLGLKSLAGIEHLYHLDRLHCSNNKLSSLEELKNLVRLRYL